MEVFVRCLSKNIKGVSEQLPEDSDFTFNSIHGTYFYFSGCKTGFSKLGAECYYDFWGGVEPSKVFWVPEKIFKEKNN